MSEVLPVVKPAFDHELHGSMVASIERLKEFSTNREFLSERREWNQKSLAWSRADVQWHVKCYEFDVRFGKVPDTDHLSYCLGLAVLKGRYALECERLLALL